MAKTWHYGLVARWWAEFNIDGPEINYFKSVIKNTGVPVLDVGCGTGRILVPCLEAGIEVHGTDISYEMIDYCQARLDSKNLKTKLYVYKMSFIFNVITRPRFCRLRKMTTR